MTTQTYPSLQQDSVRTYIVGSKSVTTFYVYAPYSGCVYKKKICVK